MEDCKWIESGGAFVCSVCGYSQKVGAHLRRNCRIVPVSSVARQDQPPPAARVANGPGTELHSMLKEMGIVPQSECACNARIAEMNAWGPARCQENRATIVAWLKESYDKSTLREKMTAALKADALLAMRIAMSRDICGTLVDEAIRRADQKQSSR